MVWIGLVIQPRVDAVVGRWVNMIFHLTSNLNKKTSVVRVLRAVKEIPRNKLWYFQWSPVEIVIIWPLLLFFADLATWIHQEITKYYTSYHSWFPALRQYKRSIMMEISEWIYSKSPLSRAMWLSVCPHHLADCGHLVVSAGRIPPITGLNQFLLTCCGYTPRIRDLEPLNRDFCTEVI